MANMELITSVTVGSGGAASVTLPATGTIPSTYTDLKILVSARTTDTNSKVMDISFNGNTSSFTNRYLLASDNSALSGADFNKFSNLQNSSSNTSNTFSNGEIYIPNYAGSNYKSYSGDGVQETNASTGANLVLVAGLWSNTAAITSITLSPVVGSWVEGSTFYLYGISNVTSTTKATGGIVSSDGTYNYHMFPFSGTFTPTTAITNVDFLVIAGGGGAAAGGGGAGGLRSTVGTTGGGGSLESKLSLSATPYTITVGAGGAGINAYGSVQGYNGGNSVFSTITSIGGGGGGSSYSVGNGGSGGGASYSSGSAPYGTGTAGQGYNGGQDTEDNPPYPAAGGGGAGQVGYNPPNGSTAGNGGNGVQITTLANPTQTGVNNGYYAGGGAGGIYGAASTAIGGLGGGANAASNAILNTGGGGGGNANSTIGGNGGSGLVIIRYAI